MEEVVQTLAETGTLEGTKGAYRLMRPAAELRLPATVQAVLAARIDRLAEREKQALETAAVIGREFTEPVLRRVVELSEIDLTAALQKLTSAEFVYEEALYPQAQYTFKHALTQEVAYNSLLNERRLTLHEQVAEAIAAIFDGRLEEHLSELADHYSKSRNTKKAIEYSQRAGERAVRLSANAEAVRHLMTALKLLETLPNSPERIEQELALQVTLGAALMASQGYAAEDVGRVYARARALCRHVGENAELFPVLWGLAAFYAVRGELQTARELGEQLVNLAEKVQDPVFLTGASLIIGGTSVLAGELPRAREHLERGIGVYDPQRHDSYMPLFGEDLGVSCLCWAAFALFSLGYPEQALKRIQEALTLAQKFSHPTSVGYALICAAHVHLLRREESPTLVRVEALLDLAAKQGFALRMAEGSVVRGWVLAMQGQGKEGIAQLRHGLSANRAIGAEFFRPMYLALLGEVYGRERQTEEGLAVLAEALGAVNKTGERYYEAEVLRLKGELLLKRPAPDEEAESCFRQAVSVSRRQSARAWELRAMTSLARLLAKQGRKDEARRMLGEIYGWFTEGFDTADLKDANALLDALS
jgi:predicted ATPase